MAQIAWIEDDYERTSALVQLLKNDRHTILTFSSWEEVEKGIETICACDAIILDIILPPIEDDPYLGVSILEQLRHKYNYQGSVVVCSRVRNPEVLRRLRELGVTEILEKPVRPSGLYKAVTEALQSN